MKKIARKHRFKPQCCHGLSYNFVCVSVLIIVVACFLGKLMKRNANTLSIVKIFLCFVTNFHIYSHAHAHHSFRCSAAFAIITVVVVINLNSTFAIRVSPHFVSACFSHVWLGICCLLIFFLPFVSTLDLHTFFFHAPPSLPGNQCFNCNNLLF